MEKALKGILRLLGQMPWGHNCLSLLTETDNLLLNSVVPPDLFDAAQRLDAHYISSRYPDAFPSGVPSDYYDKVIAEQAVEDADAILTYVQGQIP